MSLSLEKDLKALSFKSINLLLVCLLKKLLNIKFGEVISLNFLNK